MPVIVEFIVAIATVPIDRIRQAIVNDFLNPILSASIPHKRELIIKRKPYVADMAPACAFDIPNSFSTSTKTRPSVDAAVT